MSNVIDFVACWQRRFQRSFANDNGPVLGELMRDELYWAARIKAILRLWETANLQPRFDKPKRHSNHRVGQREFAHKKIVKLQAPVGC